MRKVAFIAHIFALVLATVLSVSSYAQSAPRCQALFAEKKAATFAINETISETTLNNILVETIEGHGNITSRYAVNQTEALELGERWLGKDYNQIGKPGSGVFLSADGKRRFRIDNNSLLGNHSPHKPHVHLELVNPITTVVISNNHIPLL